MNDKSVMGEVCLNQLSEISYRQSAYSLHHDKKQVKNASRKTIRPQVNQQDQAWPTSAGVTLSHSNGSPFLRELFETCSSRLRQRFGSASTRSRRLPEEHPKNSRRNTEENNTQVQSILEKPANLGARLYRPTAISCQPSAKVSSQKKKVFKYQEEAVNMQAFNKSKKSTQFDGVTACIRPGVASGDSTDLGADSFGTRCQLLRETAHRVRHQLRSNWLRGERTGRREVKPYTLYLITLKILFCVCLANARQQDGFSLSGKVLSAATGMALEGATVGIKESDVSVLTDSKGVFGFRVVPDRGTLVVSYVGYKRQELKFDGREAAQLTIRLAPEENSLDEAVVIAYGTTTRRLNTGSVSRVTAEDIARQPVSNPLAALQGRVPGLVVTQTSGVPGSAFNVQIRGMNSMAQGNDPFIIVDGVPFAQNNASLSRIGSAVGGEGFSLLNGINPNDIESIEVLKDADATAIYGSRGANGVVLITTKKAKGDGTSINVDVQQGLSKALRLADWLDTEQYVAMRKEAFRNDGTEMTANNAYDLLVWDTLRYTDWQKEAIGRTANRQNLQLNLSGGDQFTSFQVRGNGLKEKSVFAGDNGYSRLSLSSNLQHFTKNNRFQFNVSTAYTTDQNNSLTRDLTYYSSLPPNLPSPVDEMGNLRWTYQGYPISDNPYAALLKTYESETKNLLLNTQLQYELVNGFYAKVSAGLNRITFEETQVNPKSSQSPQINLVSSAAFGTSSIQNVILEPQLTYKKQFNLGKIELLVGGTYQKSLNKGLTVTGSGYASEAMLKTITGAATVSTLENFEEYRYAALFGRLNYNLKDRYLVNVTARRDGSSRFGPANRLASFGAIGAAWLFGEESFVKSAFPVLSYGKLRLSYGTSGNDAIGNYQYLGTLTATSYAYNGQSGIYPSRLFNPAYGWETNRKFEAALETGFFKDRLLLTVSYFRNRSDNQLVQYALAGQTGYTSVTRNLPATVQNQGLELSVNAVFMDRNKFHWSGYVTFSMPKNKLVAFPDIENSSYRTRYEVGLPLNIGNGYMVTGVNPETGVYEFVRQDGELISSPSYPADLQLGLASLDPKYYGGFGSDWKMGNWSFHVFFEFRKQQGYGYNQIYTSTPGLMYNQPTAVLDRWQQAGDVTGIQKFTASTQSDAYLADAAINSFGGSNRYTDASYLRLKNVALAYKWNDLKLGKTAIRALQLYLQAQNVLTLSPYKYGDPESQSMLSLPPLTAATLGMMFTL